MSKIKILSENIANQIAAGEVVERPASVVKEFVENGIDAGARRIEVQVEGETGRLIRVIDDGDGMDQDDVLLCLERHATSKLAKETDLAAIMTLGFRGEALPSIASVSKLCITSRLAAAPLGTRVEVRFGRIIKVHDMGCSPGTVMELRDLFGNVPARKKFLKSARTEFFHIEEVVRNYALCYHHLGFSLSLDQKEIISLDAATDTLESRVRLILGRKKHEPLIAIGAPLALATTEDDIRVHGFLLPPDEGYGQAARLHVFVNGRSVRDRQIVPGVIEGMQGFLMKGRRPAGVLFLEVNPASVDVNVHPAKHEVRFRRPELIRRQITERVRQGLETFQEQLKYSLFGPPVATAAGGDSAGPSVAAGAASAPAPKSGRPQALWHSKEGWARGEAKSVAVATDFPSAAAAFGADSEVGGSLKSAETSGPYLAEERLRPEPPPACSPEGAADGQGPKEACVPGPEQNLRFAGQLFDSYLLCESEAGLVVIDQHAAHERLLFERLKKQFAASGLARQTLLFSRMLEFDPAESLLIKQNWQEISELGIALEEFGDGSYLLKAVPAIMKNVSPDEIMAGVLEKFRADDGGKKNQAKGIEGVLSGMACKAAIKAGDVLQPQEATQLLRQMQEADVFSHCPHGRPVARVFSEAEIRLWFHRS